MQLQIWPPPTTTPVAVSRPNYDSRGNRRPLTFTLNAVVSLQSAMSRPRLGDGEENRFVQDSFIFIKRNTPGPVDGNGDPILDLQGQPQPPLQAGDNVSYQGENFNIAGRTRGNEPHPLTRSNPVWMGFRMQGAG